MTEPSIDWMFEQLDLQLELEDLTPEQTRDRARHILDEVPDLPRQRRIDFSIRVWVALLRSPVLTGEQREELFDNWCKGFNVTSTEVLDDLRRSIADRMGNKTTRGPDDDRRKGGA